MLRSFRLKMIRQISSRYLSPGPTVGQLPYSFLCLRINILFSFIYFLTYGLWSFIYFLKITDKIVSSRIFAEPGMFHSRKSENSKIPYDFFFVSKFTQYYARLYFFYIITRHTTYDEPPCMWNTNKKKIFQCLSIAQKSPKCLVEIVLHLVPADIINILWTCSDLYRRDRGLFLKLLPQNRK